MSSSKACVETPRKVLVCFTNQTDIWWLRLLRRDFRHCFAFIALEDRWVLYNPLSHRTELRILPPMKSAHLRRHLEGSGHHVVEIVARRHVPSRMAPIVPYSCVEAVKRLIGLHEFRVRTPFQLYRFLREHLLNKYLDFASDK